MTVKLLIWQGVPMLFYLVYKVQLICSRLVWELSVSDSRRHDDNEIIWKGNMV